MDTTKALSLAKRSLEGLSLGDAFGEMYMSIYPRMAPDLKLPSVLWRWTDDTQMALSIVENLKTYGHIDQDALARAFARRYEEEPYRGYAGGAIRLLRQISKGADWRDLSPKLFGTGSYGNGAAMRAAPIGGYFFGDPDRAAHEAQKSAVITHAHPEGQAGAMAVAVAASFAATVVPPSGADFLCKVLPYIPGSITRQRIERAIDMAEDRLYDAIRGLGTGSKVSAQDTVPFCLWAAAHHLDDYEQALWATAQGMGDCDTTCAIVGGIASLSAEDIPKSWFERREPLPDI
jgi:ADP-ribosylglycohydrolase